MTGRSIEAKKSEEKERRVSTRWQERVIDDRGIRRQQVSDAGDVSLLCFLRLSSGFRIVFFAVLVLDPRPGFFSPLLPF